MLTKPSNSSVDTVAPRQKNMTTASITLDADLDFLSLKEVAAILRVAPISIYRLIARKALPVSRPLRKILFKKTDVLDYLERSRSGSTKPYGSP